MKPKDLPLKMLDFINQQISEGLPPSVREIAKEFNINSTSTVHRYLKILEDRGHIIRGDGKNRSLKLAGDASYFNVPLVGTVAAGEPITAAEQIEGYVPFKLSSGSRNIKDYFALTVKGDSMIKAGIFDGDYVIVYRIPVAENGEIVVAMIDEEATVKRFFRENGEIRLQPENDSLEPYITNEVTILGRVVALVRNYY